MKTYRSITIPIVMAFSVLMILSASGSGYANENIKLGFAGPLSGELSSYGIPALRGVELVVDKINHSGGVLGRRVDLYVEDDECRPKDASIRASKLVVKGVHAVVGHICSGATRAALDIYREAGIITVSPSATHPGLTQSGDHPNFFRTIASDDLQAQVQVKFILEILNLERVAVLHDMTVYGKGLAEQVKGIVENNGRIELVFQDGIPAGTIEYSSILQKLRRTRADVVVFGGYHPQASKLISHLRARKMKMVFISGDGIKDEAFIVSAGKFAEGAYATAPMDTSNIPEAIAANAAYHESYGTDPGAFFLNSFAATQAILNAIRDAESTDYRAILKAMRSSSVQTPFGRLRFDDRGDAKGPYLGFTVYRVEKGIFVKVK